jgi:hypothetical protein
VKSKRLAGSVLCWLLLLALDREGAAGVRVLKGEQSVDAPVFGPLMIATGPHRIACGKELCLLVWSDERAGHGVWGQRVRADGSSPDQSSFLIAADAGDPVAAADASGFLVAYRRPPSAEVARVDFTGKVTVVATSEASHSFDLAYSNLRLAAGPNGFLLAWAPGQDAGGRVFAQRLDVAGKLVGGRLELAGPGLRDVADVVWTGQHYLVVWQEKRGADSFMAAGCRVAADGTLLDPVGFDVTQLGGYSNQPWLASNGHEVLLVAGAHPDSATFGIDIALVDADGKNARRLTLPGAGQVDLPSWPAVAWDGNQFIATWQQGTHALATRIRADGTILDSAPLVVGTREPNSLAGTAAVASMGTQSLIVFSQRHPYGMKRTSIATDGTIINPGGSPVATSGNAQRFLAAAQTTGTTLAVYADEQYGPEEVVLRAALIDGDGTPLGAPLDLDAGGSTMRAIVVGAKDTFLVIWWKTRGGSGPTPLRAARVSRTGRLIDLAPIELLSDFNAPDFEHANVALAATGSDYLFMWQLYVKNDVFTMVQRLDLQLRPLGRDVHIGSTYGVGAVALLAIDNDYLAMWYQNPGWPSPSAVRIAPDGALSPSSDGTLLRAMDSTAPQFLWLASDDTKVLFSFPSGGELLNRVGPLESAAPALTTAFGPRPPSWDGRFYTSAHFTEDSPGDLAIRQFGSDGALVDQQILSRSTVQATPPTTVGMGQGRSMVFFSRSMPESSVGNVRLRYLLLGPDSNAADGGVSNEVDGAIPGVSPTPVSGPDGAAYEANAAPDELQNPAAGQTLDAAEAGESVGSPEIDAPAIHLASDAAGHGGGGSGCHCQFGDGPNGHGAGVFVAIVVSGWLLRQKRRTYLRRA